MDIPDCLQENQECPPLRPHSGKLAFDVGWLCQVFNQGHRIRVTVASTGAPLYEPNPQTGKPLTPDFPKDAVAAVNTLHHNRRCASRIMAPVARTGE